VTFGQQFTLLVESVRVSKVVEASFRRAWANFGIRASCRQTPKLAALATGNAKLETVFSLSHPLLETGNSKLETAFFLSYPLLETRNLKLETAFWV
jgi:hypothetical protein